MVGGVLFDDPFLPEGWTRKCVQRSSGQSAGKWDVCVYNPMGKKFQSQDEIRKYLKNIGSELESDAFSFDPYSHSRPLNAKEDSSKKRKSNSKEITTSAKKQKLKAKADGANKKMLLKFDFARQKINQQHGKTGAPSNNWTPPKSPYNLLQESCWDDPWKLLLGTILLSGVFSVDVPPEGDVDEDSFRIPEEKMKVAESVLESVVSRWSEPTAMVAANVKEVSELLKDLGDEDRLAEVLIRFSNDYLLKSWEYPLELHGISQLGDDSYRLFCVGDWKSVRPSNIMLMFYHNWLLTNYAELNLC